MEKEQCICMYIYMYVYTERFTTMLRRCEYRPSCIDFRVPSLGKVKQWRCRDINLNHLSWIWPCCCAFPLATVFRPSMIHPSRLRQSVCGGMRSVFLFLQVHTLQKPRLLLCQTTWTNRIAFDLACSAVQKYLIWHEKQQTWDGEVRKGD